MQQGAFHSLAPVITGFLALAAWAVIPVAQGWGVANINVGILVYFRDLLALRLRHYHWRGWASNSKYPFVSALRSAQMVSYEFSSALF